tara:strand:+ start:3557 stop:4129 length:573 start_codon:yes stop_codon:yes gene_type:complete
MSYYTYVNKTLTRIDDLVQKLPENWKNVNGLNLFSDEKLSDMTWAGYPDYAWVPFETFDFTGYSHEPEWLEISKNNIKAEIRREKKTKLVEVLTWNGKNFIPDNDTKVGLSLIVSSTSADTDTFFWDFIGETATITKADAQQIVNFINQYSNDVSAIQEEVAQNINSADTITSLQAVNFVPSWPSTIFSE